MSEAKGNLSLWDSVEKTDPKFTKQISFGRKFTSVDAQYLLRKATQVWGTYGSRWGLKDLVYTPIVADKHDKVGKVVGTLTTMMLTGKLFYPAGDYGEGGEIEVGVDMEFKHGDDCLKKLRTAARNKALSDLGFSADVYMGKFDDAQYVQDAKDTFGRSGSLAQKAIDAIDKADSDEELDAARLKIMKYMEEKSLTFEDASELLDKITRVQNRVTTTKEAKE